MPCKNEVPQKHFQQQYLLHPSTDKKWKHPEGKEGIVIVWQKENELELTYTSWFILRVNVLPYNSIQLVFKQQRSYTVKFPGVIHYYCIFSNDLMKLPLAQSRNFWKSWSEMCNLKKLESEQNVSVSCVSAFPFNQILNFHSKSITYHNLTGLQLSLFPGCPHCSFSIHKGVL